MNKNIVVIAGFEKHENKLHNKYVIELSSLSFEEKIAKLEQDNITFAVFKNGEDWQELEKFADDYEYTIWFSKNF